MKQTLVIVGMVLLGWVVVGTILVNRNTPVLGSSQDVNYLGSAALTSSTSTVNTTSTNVLAVNTARIYARITNMGATPLFCKLDGATTAASSTVALSSGIFVAPTSTTGGNFFEINSDRLYQGGVNCLSSAASAISVVEK